MNDTRDTVDILERVERAMACDYDTAGQSARIAEAYASASEQGKALLDTVFIALCGWSVETILAGRDVNDDDY